MSSDEATMFVKVDGESGVAQDSNRDERARHVRNQVDSAGLLWETFEAVNVNVGFMG